ncbi:MAG: DNA topoisomerase, partial [Candidatus Eisenbacteria bacterium]|nr:DNA topoisomerase [Candidatus Eisenbacteria bacterium]
MKLVLAEKPSVAADIARVLGAKERKEDHYLGDGYAVTWALGHLLEIAQPEAMNAAWKKWDEATLPMLPAFWLYAPRDGAFKHLRSVSKLLREAELVIAATDAGREGEHIFRLIYQHSRSKAPVKRLWISSLTDEAIRGGFAALHAGSEFDALAAGAAARAHADWLVGLNATRAYTIRNGEKCTIGRVQTPTLALLVKRQQEIESFKSVPYAEIRVTLEPGFRARLLLDGKPRIDDLVRAKAIAQEICLLYTSDAADEFR